MANFPRDLVGFALTVTTRYNNVGEKGGKPIFDLSSAKPIFNQKLESPGFQIEHQINWKVQASSRVIQSKTHSKSKR